MTGVDYGYRWRLAVIANAVAALVVDRCADLTEQAKKAGIKFKTDMLVTPGSEQVGTIRLQPGHVILIYHCYRYRSALWGSVVTSAGGGCSHNLECTPRLFQWYSSRMGACLCRSRMPPQDCPKSFQLVEAI